jgi:hypothetical protein
MWQCYANALAVPCQPAALAIWLTMARVHHYRACHVDSDTYAALTCCSRHAYTPALPCPTGEANPQDVMACSYTDCFCVLSLSSTLVVLRHRYGRTAMML